MSAGAFHVAKRLAATLALGALTACGGGQTRQHPFEYEWHDESGRELAEFVAHWRIPPERRLAPLAAGRTRDDLLVGMNLDEGTSWRLARPVSHGPFVAGEVVVALGAGWLFAVDGATGVVVWELRAEGSLRGASDDGRTTLCTLGALNGDGSVVLGVSRDGTVVRQILDSGFIGAPVVRDGYALLPLGERGAMLFDLALGTEAARVVSSSPLTRAFVAGEDLFFGGNDALRLDAKAVAARTGGGSRVHAPARLLPGNPRWPSPVEDARARFFALPGRSSSGAPQLGDGMLTLGRMAAGLAVTGARVSWVTVGTGEVLAGAAVSGGFALCDSDGEVWFIDSRDGAETARRSLDAKLLACDIGATTLARHGLPKTPLPLERALAAAAREAHTLELPAALFFIDELAAIAGDDAAVALFFAARDVTDDKASSAGPTGISVVREHARARIRELRRGHGALLKVLAALGPWRPYAALHRGWPLVDLVVALERSGEKLNAASSVILAPFMNDPTLAEDDAAVVASFVARHATHPLEPALDPALGPALALAHARHACAASGPANEARSALRLALESLGSRGAIARASAACPTPSPTP